MVERRPLVLINGRKKELPAGDEVPGAYDDGRAAAAAPVQSVNGETGDVTLDAAAVGAQPSSVNLTGWSLVPPSQKADLTAVAKLEELNTFTGMNYFKNRVVLGATGARAVRVISTATQTQIQGVTEDETAYAPLTLRGTVIESIGPITSDGAITAAGTFTAGVVGGEAQYRRNADTVYMVINNGNVGFYDSAIPAWLFQYGRVTNLSTFRGPIDVQSVRPATDNTHACGLSNRRWTVVYAGTGTINTSDAREKTPVRRLTAAEIAAAVELGGEGGVYQWLAMIEQKGEAAREHVGMTVQRAIQVIASHGLDPFRYGFICYDHWPELSEVRNEWPAQPQVVDDFGTVVREAVEAGFEVVQEFRAAGDRFSFRPDELLAFIAAGERAARIAADAELHALITSMGQRLSALEAVAGGAASQSAP